MVTTHASRSGQLSASAGDRQLHSTFDPGKEADRFLEREFPTLASTVVIVGPGLGYLARSVRTRNETCRIICLFLSSECAKNAVDQGTVSWHPGLPTAIDTFLLQTLTELECASLNVIEWHPVITAFPEEAVAVGEALTTVIRRHVSSLMTEGANGRRWASNLFRNFIHVASPVGPQPGARRVSACVVAAAGASLEDALELIRPHRDTVALWVTGSALEAVLAAGLEPDLLVSTDPALYASEYARSAITNSSRPWPVAAPLTASRGIADAGPAWALCQSDAIESSLFREAGLNPTVVPSHGTVTGSAVQLALATSEWPVVVAGMDLAVRGLRSHARPHLSLFYDRLAELRTNPLEAQRYRAEVDMRPLSGGWRTSEPLRVYARWFATAPPRVTSRVTRLLPSPVTTGLRETDTALFSRKKARFPAPDFRPEQWPAQGERRDAVLNTLAAMKLVLKAEPGPEQFLLLRRFALDGLIRYSQTGEPVSFSEAVNTALTTLKELAFGMDA